MTVCSFLHHIFQAGFEDEGQEDSQKAVGSNRTESSDTSLEAEK